MNANHSQPQVFLAPTNVNFCKDCVKNSLSAKQKLTLYIAAVNIKIYYIDILEMNNLDVALDREERNNDSRFLIENSDFDAEKYLGIVSEELSELTCVFGNPYFENKIYKGILCTCLNQPALQSVEKLRASYSESGMDMDSFVSAVIDRDIYTPCTVIEESDRYTTAKYYLKALLMSSDAPNRVNTGVLMGVRIMMQKLLVMNISKMYSEFQTISCILNKIKADREAYMSQMIADLADMSVNQLEQNHANGVPFYSGASRLRKMDALNSLHNMRCFLKAFRKFRLSQLETKEIKEADYETEEVQTITPQATPLEKDLVPAA